MPFFRRIPFLSSRGDPGGSPPGYGTQGEKFQNENLPRPDGYKLDYADSNSSMTFECAGGITSKGQGGNTKPGATHRETPWVHT